MSFKQFVEDTFNVSGLEFFNVVNKAEYENDANAITIMIIWKQKYKEYSK